MKNTKHLLIIDNSIYCDIYKPADHWKRYIGSEIKISVITKGENLPKAKEFSHIIITGSEASINKPDAWVDPQIDFIREVVTNKIPILGSCHGHQLIAAALAGFEVVRPSKTPEFGWFEIEILKDHFILNSVKRPIWSFCSHFDEVHSLPDTFDVLARSKNCAVQIYCLKSAPIIGIQAHPEITPQEGEQLIENFLPLFPKIKDIPVNRPEKDSGFIKPLLKNFLSL